MSKYTFPAFEDLKPINELPDPFIKPDGTRVSKPEEWPEQREYLKQMLEHYMYGHAPAAPGNTTGEVLFSRVCYNGKAIAETVKITFGPGLSFISEILRPAKEGKVPVITWNQFTGRHGCPDEEEVVVRRGYAVAEFDKAELAADDASGITGPLASAYPEADWGTIAMWGWLQSRLVDYVLTTDWADPEKIIATGHSRGGKVALYCAIYDDRVAIAAPNGSGCGGVGCYRYLGGRMGEGTAVCETAGSMADCFPFWWADEFGKFGTRCQTWTRSTCADMGNVFESFQKMIMGKTLNENLMPFDLHFTRILMAPRAIISTDGLSDTWANTFGTQICWRAAQEVFDFLGAPRNNAMHMRDGKHEFQKLDWYAIVDFADEQFYGKKTENNIVFAPDGFADQPAPMAAVMKKMDWRNDRVHYSWRNPLAQD